MSKSFLCVLCNESLQSTVYNLKTSTSLYSKAPLAYVLESIAKVNFLLEDICKTCYVLLNELDGLKIQVKEITSKLKNYINDANKQFFKSVDRISGHSKTEGWNDCGIQTSNKHISCHPPNVPSEQTVITENFNTESFVSTGDCNVKYEHYFQDKVREEPFVETSTLSSSVNSELKNNSCVISNKYEDQVAKPSLMPLPNYHLEQSNESSCIKEELNNCDRSFNQERPFICEICGQAYKHKSRFKIHMNIHNGINPFKCLYCNKSFTQKVGLLRHTAIHTGDKPYQCEECGKRFIHHTSFNLHKLSHNGVKHYKCSFCDMALMSSSHLKRHMRIHTGEKKFVCSTCGKSFAEKYNLSAHEKLHLDPKPDYSIRRTFCCQICGETFWRKINLENHMMKKHVSVSRSILENVSTI